jgi:hypothetical protein
VVLAEKAGYDMVWLAEHRGTDWNLCTDPLTVLAHLAAVTNRIRFGAAVFNLTLHHLVRIAEQAHSLRSCSRDQTGRRTRNPAASFLVGQLAGLQPRVPPPSVEDVLNTFCILGSARDCHRQMDTLRKTTE